MVNLLFRAIARTGLRELLTSAALLLVSGVPPHATRKTFRRARPFVAGVVPTNSDYRHALKADIKPFKGLLLGLFFIIVDAGIDSGLLRSQPAVIIGPDGALLALKFTVLFILARVSELATSTGLLVAFALAQGGEASVLLSFAVEHSVLTATQAAPLTATIALTMALTPLLLVINEKLVQPHFARPAAPDRAAGTIEPRSRTTAS